MKIKTRVSNRNMAYFLTGVIVIVNIISVLMPLFFLYTFPTSSITNIFFTFPWLLLFIFGSVFLVYFIITGVFHFEFKADNYIIEIRSRRTISSYFSAKVKYIDMPISSIENFNFFKRPFTFNTTLMVKVKVSSRRAIAKRFNFALLSKKQKDEIRITLEKIFQNNRLNG